MRHYCKNIYGKRKYRSNRGISLVEVSLSIAFISILLASLLILFNRTKGYYESLKQRENFEKIEKTINQYAILVATAMESNCPNGFSSCPNTRLYPEVQNNRFLVFRVDNQIANIVLPSIRSRIPCVMTNNNPITFDCTGLNIVNMFYIDSNNNISTNIQPQNIFDYRTTWELIIEYDERVMGRNIPHRLNGQFPVYRVSLLESYSVLGKRTMEKMNYLKDLLKQYATTKRFQEFNNVPNLSTGVGGLNETDDFSIPWVWQVLSPNRSGLYYVCRDNTCSQFCMQNSDGTVNTGNCLPISQVWESTNLNSQAIFSRIATNLNIPNTINIATDGFGNPLIINLIANGNTPPPAPTRNYSFTRPPFITQIGTQFCFNQSNIVYDCFITFTYPQ